MFKLREAEIKDAVELREVAIKTWMDQFGSMHSEEKCKEVIEGTRNIEYITLSITKYPTILAVEIGSDKIVGYIQITTLDTEVHELAATQDSDRQIDRLYVLEEYQGLGIGKALMAAALEHEYFAEAKNIFLSVDSQDPRSQGLYKSFGFKDTGANIPFIDHGIETGHDNLFVLNRS